MDFKYKIADVAKEFGMPAKKVVETVSGVTGEAYKTAGTFEEKDENLRWLQAVLAQTEPTMWAAWGTLIEKRDYLPGLMREMVALTREKNIPWVTFGPRSKKGHPHHPLYLRKDSTPEPFDVENYLNTCFE